MSWRRNKSAATVIRSQNHTMKTNIARASNKKFRKVKPSCTKNIAVLLLFEHLLQARSFRPVSGSIKSSLSWRWFDSNQRLHPLPPGKVVSIVESSQHEDIG